MTVPESRSDDVCFVAFGARTPVGTSAPAAAAAIRAGVAAFAQHPFMIDGTGQPMIVARDPELSEDLNGPDRPWSLLAAALAEADLPLKGKVRDRDRAALFLALPPARPGTPADLPKRFEERFKRENVISLVPSAVRAFPLGHAGGLAALEEAAKSIRSEAADFCFVAGVDSYIEPVTLEWLDEREQLKREDRPWGFIPGEAACAAVLTSRRTAQRMGWKVAGIVSGVGIAREEHLIHTDSVCLGWGLTKAVQGAVRGLDGAGEKIDQAYCDINGQPYRSDEFGYASVRVGRFFADASAFEAPADCWGDVGAATGPLLLMLAAASGQKGYAKGPRVLAWTSSDAGERSAAMVRLENTSQEEAGHARHREREQALGRA